MNPDFDFSLSPFDGLSPDERAWVRQGLTTLDAPAGSVLLAPGQLPTHLYVLRSGHVQQWDGAELVASYGPEDSLDGRALVAGQASSRFVAAEPVQAWAIPRDTITGLIARNAGFGALLFADLSDKLIALAERHKRHELQSLTLARVDQAVLRPAGRVAPGTDVVSVVRQFAERRSTSVLVGDAADPVAELGIFTTSGLQKAILLGTPLQQLAVGGLASRPLITVRGNDHLFDALATMIRHRVQRVVVVGQAPDQPPGSAPVILGLLEQVDLLSFLSNHSYLVTRQIIDAQDLPALDAAAAQITRVIAQLHSAGTKVALIARLVQALNAQLFERAWQLIAPPALVANSCLFVMGSEGRGEQLLKTDQDNGLILRDGYLPPPDLPEICARFSAALSGFGYPRCPGGIMLSNPAWCQPASAFAQTARRWLLLPSIDSLMALAIFLDAHAVCGDAALLQQLRAEVLAQVTDNDALLARFAGAIEAFDAAGSGGWWRHLFGQESQRQTLDLKKAATFPLVHGVRALALAERLACTGTAERVAALVAAQRLPAALGEDLLASLHFFMRLKLDAGLAAAARGRVADGIVMADLSVLDRDLLKDTLAVVKRFKALLRQRFHLEAL